MHAGAMTDGSDDGEQVLMAMSTLQEEGVMVVKQVCVGGGGRRGIEANMDVNGLLLLPLPSPMA